MRQHKRGILIAIIATFAAIGLAYAVETGAQFEWLGTVGGLRIGGAASDPGNHTLQFSGYNSYINFPNQAFLTTPAGNMSIESSGTGYMKSTNGNCWTQAHSDGRALLKGKATSGLYALTESHSDGSVYATSAAGSAVTADHDGTAWMMGSGGGMVEAMADGTSRLMSPGGALVEAVEDGSAFISGDGGGLLYADDSGNAEMTNAAGSKVNATADGNASLVSSTANAVIATNYGDVIIRIGGQPAEGGEAMQGSGVEAAAVLVAESSGLLEDRAARIAAIKDEINNDAVNQ